MVDIFRCAYECRSDIRRRSFFLSRNNVSGTRERQPASMGQAVEKGLPKVPGLVLLLRSAVAGGVKACFQEEE